MNRVSIEVCGFVLKYQGFAEVQRTSSRCRKVVETDLGDMLNRVPVYRLESSEDDSARYQWSPKGHEPSCCVCVIPSSNSF